MLTGNPHLLFFSPKKKPKKNEKPKKGMQKLEKKLFYVVNKSFHCLQHKYHHKDATFTSSITNKKTNKITKDLIFVPEAARWTNHILDKRREKKRTMNIRKKAYT
ncbi:unnamed protein product [Coffea canephora]|uniref:Uncharacterized protein n=1 Tax=Coffea canephora TaxID=49390 RepID=A0A068TSD3_COFCA|nr:unnamed protein product [Coffea canephora]